MMRFSVRVTLSLFLLLGSEVFSAPRDLAIARRYYKDELYRAATEHYRKYLEEAPDREGMPEGRLGLARSMWKMGDLEGASRGYQEFALAYPQHDKAPTALFEQAGVLQKLGKNTKAGELYYRYSRLPGKKKASRALLLASRAAYAAGEYESAKAWSTQYLERYSSGKDRAGALVVLAKVQGKEENWKEAARNLEAAEKSARDSMDLKAARWYLARARVKLGLTESALKTYRSLLLLSDHKDSLKLSEEIGNFLHGSRHYKELTAFLKGRKLADLSENLRLHLAEALLETDQASAAIRVLESTPVGKEKPERENLLKARALLSSGERAEGIAVLKKLGQAGSASSWKIAARAYFEDGMYQQAIAAWYSAVDLLPEAERIPLILSVASVYEKKLKRFSVARSVYQDFSKTFPSSDSVVTAALGIARCLELEGRLGEARRAYLRVVEDFPARPEAEGAARRMEYIGDFLLKDESAAVQHMLVLLERGDYPARQLDIGRVLEEDLREYEKSFGVYRRFIEKSTDSTLLPLAWYRAGRMQEMLSRRAELEGRTDLRESHRKEAKKIYGTVVSHWKNSEQVDDALYRMLELEPFDLQRYEGFVVSQASSNMLPEALFRLGEAYTAQARETGGKLGQKAAEKFQKILNDFPASSMAPRARLGVSEAYFLAGENAKALPTLKILRATEGLDKSLEAASMLLEGKISYGAKQYSNAIHLFKEVEYRFPASSSAAEASYLLGRSLAATGKDGAALTAWRSYIARHPGEDDIYRAYRGTSEIYEKRGEWQKAVMPLLEFIARYDTWPEVSDAWELVGSLRLRSGERQAAVDAYRSALRTVKAGFKDHLNLAVAELLLQLDEFDSAAVFYRIALKKAQVRRDRARALGGLLPCLVMQGKKKAFNKGYREFRKNFDSQEELHARIIYYDGRHLMDTREEARARKRFSHLASRFEETSWAGEGIFYLGLIAFKKGNYRDALGSFRSYLEKNSKGRSAVDARFKAATCHYQLKEYAKAATEYGKVLEGGKGSPVMSYRSAYNAAIALEKIGKYRKAAALHERIQKEFSRFRKGSGGLVSAGFDWFSAGEYSRARETFQRALQDSSSDRIAEAHFWFAKSTDALGMVEDALEEFLKVNYLYRGDGMWGLTALFEAGQIYERSGQLDKARRMYGKIVTQDGLSGSLGSRAAKYLEQMKTAPAGGRSP